MLNTVLTYFLILLLTLEVTGVCLVNLLVAIWEVLTDTEVSEDEPE